jgi:hypothetical protein
MPVLDANLIRDTEDALTYIPDGKTGGINVIDLANIPAPLLLRKI